MTLQELRDRLNQFSYKQLQKNAQVILPTGEIFKIDKVVMFFEGTLFSIIDEKPNLPLLHIEQE